MTAASRWELVHSGPHRFFARLMAPNGEEIVRTSETYTTRRRCRDAIDLVLLYAPIAATRVREVEE